MKLDTIHHDSALCRVGTFACRPGDPRFHDSGPIGGYLLVFPRTSVVITHEGGPPEVADHTVAMVYNRGQAYRRDVASPEGDLCDWFAVPSEAVLDAVREWEPAVVERPDRPFSFRRAPTDARIYLRQREILSAVASGRELAVEDAVLDLLREVVRAHYRQAGARRAPVDGPTRRRHRDLVEATRVVLARDLDRNRTLAEVAAEVDCSPYHLSRLFRGHTGASLHAYRDQLRLRHALLRLRDPRADLTELALDAGYSSHSHFGSAFRRAFGLPPSAVRERLSARARS